MSHLSLQIFSIETEESANSVNGSGLLTISAACCIGATAAKERRLSF
jgi:hypothetical protein